MAANPPDNDDSADNENPAALSTERRDFFRISDRIGLEIHRYPPETAADDAAGPFSGSPVETLRAEFRRLDQDLRSQLATLADRDRLLASIVKSLNGKLDTLARIMAFEQNPLQPEDWQQVTLSEGGLAFTTTTSDYGIGERLSLRLTLPPELLQPVAIARILSIDPDPDGRYRVHTEFVDIHDLDRQQIARHVLRWQIRQRQHQ